MNKSGNLYFSIVVAVFLFMVLGTAYEFFKPDITSARTSLSCSATPSTDGGKMLCLVLDSVVPYFIIALISVAGGIVTEKFLL